MQISDWLQSISLITVAVTLVVTAVQSRQAIKQTRSLAKQTEYVQRTLEQSAYQTLNTGHDLRTVFFKDDASMLRWYLSERGYPVSSHRNNKCTLYLQIKLDIHENNYLNYKKGSLPDEVWQAWYEVLSVDAQISEFRTVWHAAKGFYEGSFVQFIDSLLQPGGHEMP
jgi:hypothetical protein